jgi:hypothetical protein
MPELTIALPTYVYIVLLAKTCKLFSHSPSGMVVVVVVVVVVVSTSGPLTQGQ